MFKVAGHVVAAPHIAEASWKYARLKREQAFIEVVPGQPLRQPAPVIKATGASRQLETEFGKKLGSKDVNILDPCTGTGNFIVNLMKRIPKRDLPRFYREQLFANEVVLMAYYIATLTIEHAYYAEPGQYGAVEGLSFVDTLDLIHGKGE